MNPPPTLPSTLVTTLAAALIAVGVAATSPRSAADDPPTPASFPGAAGGQAATADVPAAGHDIPEHAAVGSLRCRICHQAIWETWRGGPHAIAGASLDDVDVEVDDGCDRCHNPSIEVETGVGCEGCHGPGAEYVEIPVMIDPLKRREAGLWPARQGCDRCHNPDHPFHVERDLEAAASRIHPAPPIRIVR